MEQQCRVCGEPQQNNSPDFYCERCGSKNNPDGSAEYEGDRDSMERMEDRMRQYDWDREDNERRNHYRG